MAIRPSGFFVLRTTLLPFTALQSPLRAIVARPDVREALFLASPTLDESIAAWEADPASDAGQQVERALVRYLARMAGRPTPFGLFAGCAVGVIGDATELVVDGARRHTRLDVDYLAALCDAVGRTPEGRRAAEYRPTTALYRVGERAHYAEASLDGTRRTYHLIAVDGTDYLDATLARARDGARLEDLATALVDGDVTLDEATEYVGELVDSQILVSDLQPQVTGAEPIDALVEQLARDPVTAAQSQALDRARRALVELDRAPIGTPPSRYRDIAAGLPPPHELSRLFQVDMMFDAPGATLDRRIVARMLEAVELLRRIAPRPRLSVLTRFVEAFERRYEGREVALVEALDDEVGIGLGRAEPEVASPPWTALTTLLLHRLEDALRRGEQRIEIDDAALVAAGHESPLPLPASFAVMATLAARPEDERWFHGVWGPPGASLLGRFCHSDASLAARVLDHLRAEESQRPDALFAEIVHLPEGRTGNVLLRPLLRDHEIVYLARSGAPLDRQIPVTDLLVRVEAGRIVLRSRRLDREIVPRLTTAHDFSGDGNLAIYRFLGAMQYADATPFSFSWGPLENATFLPRVSVRSVVLALARWKLDAVDLRELNAATASERFARVQALRARRALPRWVALTDDDHVLPVDLDHALAVDALVHRVTNRTHATLTEVFDTEPASVRGTDGGRVHELVVPFVADAPPRVAASSSCRHSMVAASRRLAPGTSWLYAKLYGGPAGADRILRDIVAPVVSAARASGAARAWFFVRYGDPDLHLRVRIAGDPARLHREVLPALAAAVEAPLGAGALWRFQLDTYEREVERYGGPHGIEVVEEMFFADSDACVALIAEPHDRAWIALRGVDLLLADLGFDLPARREIVGSYRRALAIDLKIRDQQERPLRDRFRAERRILEEALDLEHDAFVARSQRMRVLAAELRAREARGELTTTVRGLAPSLVHMHVNRMLRAGAGVEAEWRIYYLLDRLYDGRIARRRRHPG